MSYKYDALIKEIIDRETVPVIDVSIDKIADEIEKRTGERPSKNTIWIALTRMGAKASGRKFVYRHNGGKE
jgi:hypothetical protein